MSVRVILDGRDVQSFSCLKTPFHRRSSRSQSVSLSNNINCCCIVIWSSHWCDSVDSHLTSERELIVSEPVLSIERHVQLCLLMVITIKSPSWSLAMDRVDQICITTVSEGVSNKLSIFNESLSTTGESTFWIAKSQ